jgi:hypothetical protein
VRVVLIDMRTRVIRWRWGIGRLPGCHSVQVVSGRQGEVNERSSSKEELIRFKSFLITMSGNGAVVDSTNSQMQRPLCETDIACNFFALGGGTMSSHRF